MPRPSAETPAGPEMSTLSMGGRPISELIDAAAEAQRAKRRLRLVGVAERSIEDLMRIAVTGGDCVVFTSAEPVLKPSATTPRRWFFRR